MNRYKDKLVPEKVLDENNLAGAAEELAGVAEQTGDMYLYAFAQNIKEDLENSKGEQPVNQSVENGVFVASSAVVTSERAKAGLPVGGIDFRSMNMLVQPAGSFSGLDFSLPMLSRTEIESFDLDEELAVIRDMVKGGMVPSGQRLKEYLAACFEKGEIKDKIDSLILCLAGIFELQ